MGCCLSKDEDSFETKALTGGSEKSVKTVGAETKKANGFPAVAAVAESALKDVSTSGPAATAATTTTKAGSTTTAKTKKMEEIKLAEESVEALGLDRPDSPPASAKKAQVVTHETTKVVSAFGPEVTAAAPTTPVVVESVTLVETASPPASAATATATATGTATDARSPSSSSSSSDSSSGKKKNKKKKGRKSKSEAPASAPAAEVVEPSKEDEEGEGEGEGEGDANDDDNANAAADKKPALTKSQTSRRKRKGKKGKR